MATPSEILRVMIDNVEPQSANLESNIDQVQNQIDALNVEIDGVQNGLCGVAESELISYLNGTKIPALEILYGGDLPYSVSYGPTFGTIDYTTGNITDWQVLDSTGGVVYQYLGVHWDSDVTITQKISDYAFGNDYLTRPLTSGASYGLIPSRDNLSFAKSLLQENKDKVDASATTFEDYAV